jgi:hypothetical protein
VPVVTHGSLLHDSCGLRGFVAVHHQHVRRGIQEMRSRRGPELLQGACGLRRRKSVHDRIVRFGHGRMQIHGLGRLLPGGRRLRRPERVHERSMRRRLPPVHPRSSEQVLCCRGFVRRRRFLYGGSLQLQRVRVRAGTHPRVCPRRGWQYRRRPAASADRQRRSDERWKWRPNERGRLRRNRAPGNGRRHRAGPAVLRQGWLRVP